MLSDREIDQLALAARGFLHLIKWGAIALVVAIPFAALGASYALCCFTRWMLGV